MAPNILVLTGSARKESDTAHVVRSVFPAPIAKVVDLLDHKIAPYSYEGNYPAGDDFMQVVELMQQHQNIVFATPVYWYAMSGLMKVFFDRLTDLVTTHKGIGRSLKGKKTFLVAVGADQELPPGFDVPFKLTSEYLGMEFKGVLYCKNSETNVIQGIGTAFRQAVLA